MDSHGNTDTTLRLAVGVALVPVGALVALTGDRTERKMETLMCETSSLVNSSAVGRKV